MRLRPAGVRAASALGIASENQPRRFRSRVQGGSFDCAPGHGKATHDGVDTIDGLMLSLIREMGVANGGQNGLMAQDLLNLNQIHTGFNQMRGIAVAQAVR